MSRITATLNSGMAVAISNGQHNWNADEPLEFGGTDSGPSPYELLLGSLAACTCVTLSWYCQYKKLPLHSITTSYDFARVHAEDCKDCDIPDKGLIEKIESNIHIEGDFDDAQQKRLAQIAERCPVHKTLAQGVNLVDNTTFGQESKS